MNTSQTFSGFDFYVLFHLLYKIRSIIFIKCLTNKDQYDWVGIYPQHHLPVVTELNALPLVLTSLVAGLLGKELLENILKEAIIFYQYILLQLKNSYTETEIEGHRFSSTNILAWAKTYVIKQTKWNCNWGDWGHFFVTFRDKGLTSKSVNFISISTEMPI